MTPHEVIKVNIESVTRLLKKYSSAGKTIVDTEILIDSIENLSELCFAKGRQDSKVDTFLSVKDMIEQRMKKDVGTHVCLKLDEITFTSEKTGKEICVHQHEVETHNKPLEDIKSLLDTEINKTKEL